MGDHYLSLTGQRIYLKCQIPPYQKYANREATYISNMKACKVADKKSLQLKYFKPIIHAPQI